MVLDVVRVEKGRWQDDHILIIGYLATLKGDQMKNRNVQIPYELFFQLLQYFLIGLIVARSKNNVIGKNGNIPWKIKGEQKQFRELTTGNVVIMGRKSYEEIGHPLPNRMNIVVSTTTEYQGDNLVSVKSLEDALLLAKGRDVYISGGYGLFKEALQIVDKMYITEVDLNIEDGDTFFPEFDINDFEVLIGETLGEEVKYTRTFYVRKK